MTTATKFTPDTAQAFNRYSSLNASTVKMRLSCGCEPYKDVFTYARWQALGYQVQRGQRSIKIPVVIEKENDDGETLKRLFNSHVFCRCQVKPISDKTESKPVETTAIKPIEPIKPVIEPIQPKVEPEIKSNSDSPINNIMKGWQVV